jgi:hypothetical protein
VRTTADPKSLRRMDDADFLERHSLWFEADLVDRLRRAEEKDPGGYLHCEWIIRRGSNIMVVDNLESRTRPWQPPRVERHKSVDGSSRRRDH